MFCLIPLFLLLRTQPLSASLRHPSYNPATSSAKLLQAAEPSKTEDAAGTVEKQEEAKKVATETEKAAEAPKGEAKATEATKKEAAEAPTSAKKSTPQEMEKTRMDQSKLDADSKHVHGKTQTADWRAEYPMP